MQQVSSSVCTPNKTDVYSLPSLIRSLESLKGNINTLYSLNVLYKDLNKKYKDHENFKTIRFSSPYKCNGFNSVDNCCNM